MSKQVLQDRAAALLALHVPGNPAILPTVWDAWSAKLAVDAGFAALTVGSHPVADSVGKADGEGMSFDDLTNRVAQITGAVDVPISVDIESGYGEPPQRLIEGLLSAGAVGLNVEDTVHKEGKRLRSAEEHAALVGELRKAADAADVCTWSSTPAPICSCATTGTTPIASSGRWLGSSWPRRQAPTACIRQVVATRKP